MSAESVNQEKHLKAITVYCASSQALDAEYYDAARHLGTSLAQSGRSLVYGGGNLGLMGAVAEAVQQNGGHVHGIITEKLSALEQARTACDKLEIVATMRLRKQRMEELADAFIALPGGLGTFEELFEIIVGRLLGEHTCPIILINIKGYYDPFVALFEHAIAEGFIKPGVLELFEVVDSVDATLASLARFENESNSDDSQTDLSSLIPSN